ncbi:hypothetical protein ACFVZM_22645 [Streptomyces sioyaensis]|uniref:hypothetical protein n=1 Tax=Streptomyces sioyaensis TaxID=67364 RepID=UPI003679A9A1
MALTVTGIICLTMTGHLLLPFERVTTLKGRLASISDFFEDPQVIRILRKHGLRVEAFNAGSRQVATGSLKGLDFVFPSGKPAADRINDARQAAGEYSKNFHPFDSPLVLASFRPYAEALHARQVALPQRTPGGGAPLYYTLDMDRFLSLTRQRLSWNDLHVDHYGISNGNLVVAQTSDICQSNSADSYLGLVASTRHHNAPPTDTTSARALARGISSLLLSQGSASDSLYTYYIDSNGISQDPIAVLYEHQYLAYQATYRAAHGTPDTERVLLYPRAEMMSQPHFIALNHQADQLGKLLETDPELRRRETQLGYQLVPSDSVDELATYLNGESIPAPQPAGDEQTVAKMPDWQVLEQMIAAIKRCPKPVSGQSQGQGQGQ